MVVLSQNFDDVEPGGQRIVNFTVPRRGTLVVTVGWNDPANSVVAVLTGTGCRNLRIPDGDCSTRRSVERGGKGPASSSSTSPDAAGSYQLLAGERGSGPGVDPRERGAHLRGRGPADVSVARTDPASVTPPAPNPRRSGYPR